MRLIRATEKDSERLAAYYKEINWFSAFDFKRQRLGSFFDKYRLQSDDWITCMLIDEKDKIQATASIVFCKAWVEGEEQVIGYASDLQVSLKRSVILKWPNIFFPLLEEEKKKRNCKYVFSVFLTSQRKAYNAFVRPRSLRRQLPRYYLFRKFHIISIHGLFPFTHKPLETIITRQATESDKDILAEYIIKKSREKPLFHLNSKEDLFSRLQRWKNLDLQNFILAFNNGNLVGCTAPWSNRNLNKMCVVKENSFGMTFRQILSFLSLFGFSHKLYAKEEKEIKFQYMTHTEADNPDIFYSLLYQAYQNLSKEEFLVYPHFDGEILKKVPTKFISGSVRCGSYCILSADTPLPYFLRPKALEKAPEFELTFM